MTTRFMREGTSIGPEPSILHLCQSLEMFLSAPVSLFARHFARLLFSVSANTFTFLVLLGNKRGGMSGGPHQPW